MQEQTPKTEQNRRLGLIRRSAAGFTLAAAALTVGAGPALAEATPQPTASSEVAASPSATPSVEATASPSASPEVTATSTASASPTASETPMPGEADDRCAVIPLPPACVTPTAEASDPNTVIPPATPVINHPELPNTGFPIAETALVAVALAAAGAAAVQAGRNKQ